IVCVTAKFGRINATPTTAAMEFTAAHWKLLIAFSFRQLGSIRTDPGTDDKNIELTRISQRSCRELKSTQVRFPFVSNLCSAVNSDSRGPLRAEVQHRALSRPQCTEKRSSGLI